MTDAETNYADVLTSMAADGHGYFAQADITRFLEDQLARCNKIIDDYEEEHSELRAEIERLRAALREAREDILLRHNARGSEAAGTDKEAVSFIDAALAEEKTDG